MMFRYGAPESEQSLNFDKLMKDLDSTVRMDLKGLSILDLKDLIVWLVKKEMYLEAGFVKEYMDRKLKEEDRIRNSKR